MTSVVPGVISAFGVSGSLASSTGAQNMPPYFGLEKGKVDLELKFIIAMKYYSIFGKRLPDGEGGKERSGRGGGGGG